MSAEAPGAGPASGSSSGSSRCDWSGPDAKALLIQHDSGLVVLYGALLPGSYKEFGLGPGARVKRGDPLGRIGTYPAGSSMLHLETYVKGTTDNAPWYQGKPPPPEILNPTDYLRLAAQVSDAERAGPPQGQGSSYRRSRQQHPVDPYRRRGRARSRGRGRVRPAYPQGGRVMEPPATPTHRATRRVNPAVGR